MGGAHGSTAKEAKEAESMIETLEMTPLLKDIEPDAALKVICPLFVRMKIKEEESIYGPKSMQPDDMCVVESGALRLLTKHGIPGQEGGTELHRYGAGDVLGATQMAQGIESVTAAKQKGGKNAAKNVHDNSPTDVLAGSGHDVVAPGPQENRWHLRWPRSTTASSPPSPSHFLLSYRALTE